MAVAIPEPVAVVEPDPSPPPAPTPSPDQAPLLDCPSPDTESDAESDPWLQPGEERWRKCAHTSCRAGRYTVESIEDEIVTVRVLESMASSEGHPNGYQLLSTLELYDKNPRHRLEKGQTYALILSQHGMRYFAPALIAADDDAGVARVGAVHCSPETYENSLAWQARRASWRGLLQHVELNDMLFQATIRAWAESDDQKRIAFIIGGGAWFVYNRKTQRISANVLSDDPTNITYEDGHFVLWNENRRLVTRAPFFGAMAPTTSNIDVRATALTFRDHRSSSECAGYLCYGGVFTVDHKATHGESFMLRGRFTQVVSSAPGHPNANPPEALEVFGDFERDIGDSFVLLASQHSTRQPASAIAWAEASSTEALDDVRAILSHRDAFQNDPESRRLHALFDGYRRAWTRRGETAPTVGVWGTDPEYQHLVTAGWTYDTRDGEVSGHLFQKSRPPAYNRITYDEKRYTLWYNDDAYIHLGV